MDRVSPHTEEFSTREFVDAGLLWAVNQFVLWPLGLAISVEIGSDPKDGEERPAASRVWGQPGAVALDRVIQWAYADGRRETIESPSAFDDDGHGWQDRWEAFRGFVAERLASFPESERVAAIARLAVIGIVVENGVVVTERPRDIWAMTP